MPIVFVTPVIPAIIAPNLIPFPKLVNALLSKDCFVDFVALDALFKVEFILLILDGKFEKAADTFTISVAKGPNAFVNSFILDVKVAMSELFKFLLISGILSIDFKAEFKFVVFGISFTEPNKFPVPILLLFVEKFDVFLFIFINAELNLPKDFKPLSTAETTLFILCVNSFKLCCAP